MKNKVILYGIIFLDVLSVGIIIPVLPAIFGGMNLPVLSADPSINLVIWYSVIIGLHPVFGFFSTSYLGTLSDRVGRKWILVTSLAGSVVAFGISAVGVGLGSLLLLAIGRVIDGCTAGNIAVARASLIDMTPKEKMTSILGVVGAFFGIGLVAGPLLGSLSWSFFGLSQASAVVVVATAISLAATLVTLFFYKETLTELEPEKPHTMSFFPKIESKIRPHILSGVLFIAGFGMFATYWSVFLFTKFGFDQRQLAAVFIVTGVSMAVVQGLLVRRVVQEGIPQREVLLTSLPLLVVSSALLAVVPLEYLYVAIAWFSVWNGLTMANRLGMINTYGERYGQGYVSGTDAAYTAIASAAAPLLLALVSFGGLYAPFAVIVVLFASSWFVCYKYCYSYKTVSTT